MLRWCVAAQDKVRRTDACQPRSDRILVGKDRSAAPDVFEKTVDVAARRAAM
jgi:hypothetical protein